MKWMKIASYAALFAGLIPLTCLAESGTTDACKAFDFYVANCSTQGNMLFYLGHKCQSGNITILSESAFKNDFIAFTLAEDNTSADATATKTPSTSNQPASATPQAATTPASNVSCVLELLLMDKDRQHKTVYLASVKVDRSDDGSCTLEKSGLEEKGTDNKAKEYLIDDVESGKKVLFGICEGELSDCACPQI